MDGHGDGDGAKGETFKWKKTDESHLVNRISWPNFDSSFSFMGLAEFGREKMKSG